MDLGLLCCGKKEPLEITGGGEATLLARPVVCLSFLPARPALTL